LALDGNNASALAAKSRCATARGRVAEGVDLAGKAAAADPANVGLAALAIRVDVSRGDPAARERAVALTAAHGEHVAAWDALIAWGSAHHDVVLVVRGLEGLVRVAPARSVELEKAALVLLAADPPLAHRLAVAVSDAPRALSVVGPRDATVARLAVDDALAHGDKAAALARATRGHVPLAEVAARALLLDHSDLALAIATSVADADPSSTGALMVKFSLRPPLAARASAPPAAIPGALVDPRDQPPELCALVFADDLARTAGVETAKAWLAKVTRTPMPERDPLGIALTTSLATRGVLSAPLHVAQ